MTIMKYNPDEIQDLLKSGKITIAVIGLGRIGLPTAVLFANAGAKVIGVDVDEKKVEMVNNVQNYIDEPGLDELFEKVVKSKNLVATTDGVDAVKKAHVSIICVPTPVIETKAPDYRWVISATETIAKGIQKDAMVIIESTVAPGTLEELVIPIIEKKTGMKAGIDFGAASCPERADPGTIITKFDKIPRIVGGINEKSTQIAKNLYSPIVNGKIVTVSNPKTANAVKLTENIFRDVNIALMNEFAVLYEKLGINAFEVIQGASTKWNFLPHYPGAGVGGPCLPANSYYIVEKGFKVGFIPYIIRLAREVNDRMPHEVVRITMEALNEAKKPLNGSKIAILGITYKPGVKDTQISPAHIIVDELIARKVNLLIYDPLYKGEEFHGIKIENSIDDAIKDADAIVFITAHKEFKELSLESLAKKIKSPPVIVDGRGIFALTEKPSDIIYRGIGLP